MVKQLSLKIIYGTKTKKTPKKSSSPLALIRLHTTLIMQSVLSRYQQAAAIVQLSDASFSASVSSSSWANVSVSDKFLHPLYLAFVLGHGFVIHAVLQ